ncbi:methyltransferase domain-containing protein [Paenibacillus xylanexedens]|uniref:methyltransferase domain-containing protein n=1 Tax=Paenibacillus xylanexedens TaxID=528191 RepID=UPI003D01B3DC
MDYLSNSHPDSVTWDKVASNYVLELTDSEQYLASQIEQILNKLNVPQKAKLLELGSGSGHISGLLSHKGYDVTLLDFSNVALEQSKTFFESHNLEGEFINGDITNLNAFSKIDQEFDVVWNSGVMEHFDGENLTKVFNEIKKVKAKFYVFLVPNPMSLPYLLFRYKLMQEENWIYGKEYLRSNYDQFLEDTGFKIADKLYIGEMYMSNHMEVVFGQDGSRLFNEMAAQGFIPDINRYLIAYVATNDGNIKLNKNSSKELILDSAEYETVRFDLIARCNGLSQQLKMALKETEKLEQEHEELRRTHEKFNHEVEEAHRETIEIIKKTHELSFKESELNYSGTLKQVNIEIDKLKLENAKFESDVEYLRLLLAERENRLNDIQSSKFWSIATKFYNFRDRSMLSKSLRTLKNEGIKAVLSKAKRKIKKSLIKMRYKNENLYELRRILKENKDKTVVIFPPLLDWNIPLFQRPQHIAINLAKQGYLYFYCTINNYDSIQGFEATGDKNMYITDQYELILKHTQNRVMHYYAQDSNVNWEMIKTNLIDGDVVLYEFLDALHEDLCTSKNNVIDRHINVLKDERVIVVATADRLLKEVESYRNKNYQLVTNGVDVNHFKRELEIDRTPEIIKVIKERNKPVIGYFGALAKWFDYKLVIKLAVERPEYEILLIGWDYDGSLPFYNLDKYENITVIGPINYVDLPYYADIFTVSTIPFLLNEITEATSPIKLFEYMAMGKPIVTSNLPECRKYESVLIGETHDQFLEKVDHALNLVNDQSYNELITKEALANTWEQKATDISKMIQQVTRQ